MITFYESIWLYHIATFFKMAIKKCHLDIYLQHLIVIMSCNRSENSKRFKHNSRRKCLLVIEIVSLGKTLSHQLYFEGFHSSIHSSIFLVDPLISNKFYTFSLIYKSLDLIRMHGFHFIIHSSLFYIIVRMDTLTNKYIEDILIIH